MSNQQQTGAGTVYDGDNEVVAVTYELTGEGPGATGILTFPDILVREQVRELLEEGSLILATQAGQRWSFVQSGTSDGATPILSIHLAGSQ